MKKKKQLPFQREQEQLCYLNKPVVGIYERKQESKKTKKQEQESNQEKKRFFFLGRVLVFLVEFLFSYLLFFFYKFPPLRVKKIV